MGLSRGLALLHKSVRLRDPLHAGFMREQILHPTILLAYIQKYQHFNSDLRAGGYNYGLGVGRGMIQVTSLAFVSSQLTDMLPRFLQLSFNAYLSRVFGTTAFRHTAASISTTSSLEMQYPISFLIGHCSFCLFHMCGQSTAIRYKRLLYARHLRLEACMLPTSTVKAFGMPPRL